MSTLQVVCPSRDVRLAVESRQLLVTNEALALARAEFAVDEVLLPPINFEGATDGLKNYWRGEWSQEDLAQMDPDWPALAFWVGDLADLKFQKPRRFSGALTAFWRWFLVVPGITRDVLTDLRECTEAATLATVASPGLGYLGDLKWTGVEKRNVLADDDRLFGWSLVVTYQATFEVHV